MEKLLSIIVPVYNTEEYLCRCLESIFDKNADSALYEVIAVNDGSPDNSMHILRGFCGIYSNMLLIDKENGGVSSARNLALQRAAGKYVAFVDSDDAIFDGALVHLLDMLKECKDDIVVMRSFMHANVERYGWSKIFNNAEVEKPISVINRKYSRGSVCGCAFSTSLLRSNGILFPEGVRNGEDTIFFFMSLFWADSVRFQDIKFYNVIGREGSASNTYTAQRLDSSVLGVKFVCGLIERFSSDEKVDIFKYLKYILIDSIVKATISTPGCGYRYLRKLGLDKLRESDCRKITYAKYKMAVMNRSLLLYYILVIFKKLALK